MGKKRGLKKMRKAAKQLKGKPILVKSSKGTPYVMNINQVKGDKVLLNIQQVGFPGFSGSGLLGGLGGASGLGGLGGLGGALSGGLSMIVPMIKLFGMFGPGLLKGLGGLSSLGVGGINSESGTASADNED